MEVFQIILTVLFGLTDFLIYIKYMEIFFRPRYSFRNRLPLFGLLVVLVTVLSMLGRMQDTYLTTAALITVYLFLALYFFEGKAWKRALLSLSEPVLLGTCGLLLDLLMNRIFILDIAPNSYIYPQLNYFVVYILLYMAISLIEIHRNRANPGIQNPYQKSILAVLSVTIAFLFAIVSYYRTADFSKGSFETLLCIVFICIQVFVLATLLLYQNLLLQLKSEYESRLALKVNELERDFYDKIKENADSLRTLRHDLKNHLLVIEGCLENGRLEEARAYMKEITHTVAKAGAVVEVSNVALSSILTRKKHLCLEKRISLQTDISLEQSFVTDAHLCTIVSNLLDNAIEAASQVPDSRGYIDFCLTGTRHTLSIRCTNNYTGELRTESGRVLEGQIYPEDPLLTTKKNAAAHGIGLFSVRRIAAVYHGTVETLCENHEFNAEVLLKNG